MNYYLKVSFYNHGEVGVVSLGDIFLIFAQLDGNNVTQMWTWVIPAVKIFKCFQLKNAIRTYLDPAMNPRMRAFSGLVTLLAVLNISWASNICSLVRERFLLCCGATGV